MREISDFFFFFFESVIALKSRWMLTSSDHGYKEIKLMANECNVVHL